MNNSDVVGSATATAGKYVFSMPSGFSLYENNGNSALIENNNELSIYFESNLTDSDTYNNLLNKINNESNDKILSKGTLNIDNTSVDTVYFQTTHNVNKSAFYFEKDNTHFKIVISNFNYDADSNLTLSYATLIIKSTHYNYKMGK